MGLISYFKNKFGINTTTPNGFVSLQTNVYQRYSSLKPSRLPSL